MKKAICIYAVSLLHIFEELQTKKKIFQYILEGNCMEKCGIKNVHQM